tara:strand:+ start:1493 stop:1888 length:396 start_codon:yes stop_codon:yes gene_type:complete
VIFSCSGKAVLLERQIFVQKLEALKFLSDYHHQLHIMIGEDEGDGYQAYSEFSSAISKFNNPELIPVVSSFDRIKRFSVASESVMRLDYLIDYYQSGLSLQVEAILRGHGYLKTFPIDSAVFIYDKLQADS